MQHDSAGISNNLKNKTTYHADHETPSFVLNAERELREQKQSESNSVDEIAHKCRYIFHLSAAEGALPYGAVGNGRERTRI
jgi:hypothetical protein